MADRCDLTLSVFCLLTVRSPICLTKIKNWLFTGRSDVFRYL